MVKLIFFVAITSAHCAIANTFTNAMNLVGVSLTTNEILRLPSRDSTTPDTVFLGTIKALQQGCITDLYYHFETNYLFETAGFGAVDQIPNSVQASFGEAMEDNSFSNLIITAYSAVPTNQEVRISASIREGFTKRTLNETIAIIVRKIGSRWEVTSYE